VSKTKTKVGVLIPADSTLPIREYQYGGTNGDYEGLKAAVGGYIERIEVKLGKGPKLSLWCNEESKLIGLPKNDRATKLAVESLWGDDFISGDVLLALSTRDFTLAEFEQRGGVTRSTETRPSPNLTMEQFALQTGGEAIRDESGRVVTVIHGFGGGR
jgi:hypothetical protein